MSGGQPPLPTISALAWPWPAAAATVAAAAAVPGAAASAVAAAAGAQIDHHMDSEWKRTPREATMLSSVKMV